MTLDGNNWYLAQRASQIDFYATQQFSITTPIYYPFGDTVYGFKPDGQAGTARLSYYTLATELNDDGDELPQPMRSYTKSFVDYGLAQALQVDGKPDEAKMKLRDAENALSLFISDITPRSSSGPQYIHVVDDVSGDGGEIIY
jgi:hypothetical protein